MTNNSIGQECIINEEEVMSNIDKLVIFLKRLKVTHLVIERNLFRKSLLPNNNDTPNNTHHTKKQLTPSNYHHSSPSESEFHFRYFTGSESFIEWTKTAVLNPLFLKCSDLETHVQTTQTLMQSIKGKTMPTNSRKGELISEVLVCLELLSLFWIRLKNDDRDTIKNVDASTTSSSNSTTGSWSSHEPNSILTASSSYGIPVANRAVSFSSEPYCKAAQELQQSLPSQIREFDTPGVGYDNKVERNEETCSDPGNMAIWSFLWSNHDDFKRLANNTVKQETLVPRNCVTSNGDNPFTDYQNVVTSGANELLRCFNNVLDSSEERIHFFDCLISILSLKQLYYYFACHDKHDSNNEAIHESISQEEWKMIFPFQDISWIPKMQELNIKEQITLLKTIVNQLYNTLFQWFQMKVNDYLVQMLQSVRGGYDETQGIPPELLLENQYLLIELVNSYQTDAEKTFDMSDHRQSLIHKNHLEKFQKFRERKRQHKSMTNLMVDKTSALNPLEDTSENSQQFNLIKMTMTEMIKQLFESKFGNISTFTNDFAYMSLFEKSALSYVFCLNSNIHDDYIYKQRIVSYLPEIVDFKRQILSVMSDVKLDVHVLDKAMNEFGDHTNDVLLSTNTSQHEIPTADPSMEVISPDIIITNIPIPTPISPPESKKKIFTIKKTKQREQRELELLQEEVDELEKQIHERKELISKIENLKREKGSDQSTLAQQVVDLKEISVLEKTIVKARSCLALCNVYHCDWYRDKIVEYLDELRELVETCENPSDVKEDSLVLKHLQDHLDEHSYYIGFQLPSLFTSLQDNTSATNCANFKGFQRLYKYMDIIENHVDIIPLSPLNVAECLKLCTRKLQSDLEILTQVRHFRSITLYNNHEIGCRVVKCIELLSLKSPYRSLISLLLNEFHTFQVASELLRLSLKHFQAFKDYVYALLHMIQSIVEKITGSLDEHAENILSSQQDVHEASSCDRKELDSIASSLSNASFTFSLIFAFNMSYSELHWNETTVFDILSLSVSRDSYGDTVTSAHTTLNLPIARTALCLLRLLLHNNYIFDILNSCNRIERLLPENLIQALRTCSDIELQNEVIQLIDLGARKIAYKSSISQDMTMCDLPIAEDASQFNEQVLGEIVNQKNCFTLFNYRDMFLDDHAPQILLLILHNHVMHYVDGNFGNDFSHKKMVCLLTQSICNALYALLTENSCDAMLNLFENERLQKTNSAGSLSMTSASALWQHRPSVDMMSLNQSFASSLSENGMKREIYSCLFYVLLQALLIERRSSIMECSSSDEQNNTAPYIECELFKVSWHAFMDLMRSSGEFRRCVDRQFASVAYLRDLSFLQLLLGTFNHSHIRIPMTKEIPNMSDEWPLLDKQDQLLKIELEKYGPDVLQDLHYSRLHSDDHIDQSPHILECTPYELAKEVLLFKRIHARYEFDTNSNTSSINPFHNGHDSVGPSLIEALCEKYTSGFFSHYAEQGLFEWNEEFSSVLEHSQEHEEELLHLQYAQQRQQWSQKSPKRSNENNRGGIFSPFQPSPQQRSPLPSSQQTPSKTLSHHSSVSALPGISPIKKMMTTQFPSSPSLPSKSSPPTPQRSMKPKKLFF
ncbi:hypothetical protein C9374_011009 [Naegleria lovaniensis]|uniref:Uncharacterized protein n=1 Tax=Naegleria lovaniensis TaxID=51637 RepID=A0AA88GEK5_NAELO|nr:uncharacterized protein C9374_011009 [Naegleria lovaniensis]KAG2374172.1 hypothetical protein C9374_011009 [Naegleria lovaniensis]